MPGTFARYVLRLFAARVLAVLLALSAVLTVFDVLANADRVLDGGSPLALGLLAYAGLRAPAILVLLVPLATLLAAVAVLARLSTGSELIAIRAAGVSMFRLGASLLLGAAVIAAAQFWFAGAVVPETAGRLRLWAARDFAGLPPIASPRDAPSWFAVGNTLVHVDGSSLDGRRLDRPTVIARDSDGRLDRFLTAATARFEQGRWVLHQARRPLDPDTSTTPRLRLDLTLDPDRFSVLSGDPEELRFATLLTLRGEDDLGRRPDSYYGFWIHRKLAQPAANLVMVLLALPVGLQLGRRNRTLAAGLLVLAGGFLFLIAERLLIPMGENGLLPPPVAAWTPLAVFAALGTWVLLTQET